MLDVRGMRVLVTGHTGFKGAWLCEWLLHAGARVHGIALPPESDDALFVRLRQSGRLDHAICDIRHAAEVAQAVKRADPEIVFHLAAQAIVRRSYREPLLTWETNVIGTLNVLQAAKSLGRAVTVVVVTSDKVYKNREWDYAYREDDELGGHDPYSASKAGCEIAVASWRASFGDDANGVTVVTARAGNVLGAGDVSEDRIIPDCFRAWTRGAAVEIRQPRSTRPWQHVLEPLSGYLVLAEHARVNGASIETCNFGPDSTGLRTVEELVMSMARFDASRRWTVVSGDGRHEARMLALSIDRARHRLGWTPLLSVEETVEWTNDGYVARDTAFVRVVERQIAEYGSRRSTLATVGVAPKSSLSPAMHGPPVKGV